MEGDGDGFIDDGGVEPIINFDSPLPPLPIDEGVPRRKLKILLPLLLVVGGVGAVPAARGCGGKGCCGGSGCGRVVVEAGATGCRAGGGAAARTGAAGGGGRLDDVPVTGGAAC
jgi:hypothetical protein